MGSWGARFSPSYSYTVDSNLVEAVGSNVSPLLWDAREARNIRLWKPSEAEGCLSGDVKHQGLEITRDEMSLDQQQLKLG